MGAFLSDSLSWFSLYLTHTHTYTHAGVHTLFPLVCVYL